MSIFDVDEDEQEEYKELERQRRKEQLDFESDMIFAANVILPLWKEEREQKAKEKEKEKEERREEQNIRSLAQGYNPACNTSHNGMSKKERRFVVLMIPTIILALILLLFIFVQLVSLPIRMADILFGDSELVYNPKYLGLFIPFMTTIIGFIVIPIIFTFFDAPEALVFYYPVLLVIIFSVYAVFDKFYDWQYYRLIGLLIKNHADKIINSVATLFTQ